jgi:hypothetical protein
MHTSCGVVDVFSGEVDIDDAKLGASKLCKTVAREERQVPLELLDILRANRLSADYGSIKPN